ncbi:hypothetical protein V1525DRAFT_444477 [Lipomyces kononenkoae]|uniref:Uncharacterized protein n=1 Tax=Lipomyces kononenkoae TaxID=34357 RepID=A0ACC3SYA4_LIPKO
MFFARPNRARTSADFPTAAQHLILHEPTDGHYYLTTMEPDVISVDTLVSTTLTIGSRSITMIDMAHRQVSPIVELKLIGVFSNPAHGYDHVTSALEPYGTILQAEFPRVGDSSIHEDALEVILALAPLVRRSMEEGAHWRAWKALVRPTFAPGHDDLSDLRSERWLEIDTVTPLGWFAMAESGNGAGRDPIVSTARGTTTLYRRPLTGTLWTERVPGLAEGEWSGFWPRLPCCIFLCSGRSSSGSGDRRHRVCFVVPGQEPAGSAVLSVLRFPPHLGCRGRASSHFASSADGGCDGRPPVLLAHVMLYAHLVWGSYRRRVHRDGPPPILRLVQWGSVIRRSVRYQQSEEPWE